MLFAIDQQQYLQGYLPVVFAMLYVTNLNTVGNGAPVLTGPGIINKANALEGRGARGEGNALDHSARAGGRRAARPTRRGPRWPRPQLRQAAAGRAARHVSARSRGC